MDQGKQHLIEPSMRAPNDAIYGQFFAAVDNGKIEDVKLCLETHEININLFFSGAGFVDSDALYVAATNGDADMIELLLANGAKVAEYDMDCNLGETALLRAAYFADVRAIRLLLDRGAEVNKYNSSRTCTPLLAVLHSADTVGCVSKHREAIKILVERGADLFAIQGSDGATVWTQAAVLGDIELLQYLLAAGCNVDDRSRGKVESTALARAVISQRPKTVEFLLDSGATIHKEIIRMARTVEIFDVLRFRVDQRFLETSGIFQQASGQRLLELVQHLISIGMDVNGRHNGDTGLMTAVEQRDSSDVIKLLVSAGADVSLLTLDTGDTALHLASYLCDLEVVDILLKALSDVHTVNFAGRTPLASFARDIGFTYGYTRSMLQKSAHCRLEALRLLIQAGSDLDAQDEFCRTPLHEVVLKQRELLGPSEVQVTTVAASMLIEVGARTDIPDCDNKTVRDLIMDHGHVEMRTLISETCPEMDSGSISHPF